jgi:hypothetical protein
MPGRSDKAQFYRGVTLKNAVVRAEQKYSPATCQNIEFTMGEWQSHRTMKMQSQILLTLVPVLN